MMIYQMYFQGYPYIFIKRLKNFDDTDKCDLSLSQILYLKIGKSASDTINLPIFDRFTILVND